MAQCEVLVTDAGSVLESNAKANGNPVELTEMALSDATSDISASQTTIPSIVYQAALNGVRQDPNAASQWIAELVVPSDVGGFTVRQAGIFASDGTLYAVADLPEQRKPDPQDCASDFQIQLVFAVVNADQVTLAVDGTSVFATQDYVDSEVSDLQQQIDNIDTSGAPDATTSQKGIIEIATQTEAENGTDTKRAMTPATTDAAINKRIAEGLDGSNLPAATTTQHGVVELATKNEALNGQDSERAVTPFTLNATIADQLDKNGFRTLFGANAVKSEDEVANISNTDTWVPDAGIYYFVFGPNIVFQMFWNGQWLNVTTEGGLFVCDGVNHRFLADSSLSDAPSTGGVQYQKLTS